MFSERWYTDAPEIYIRPLFGISFLWLADKGIARTQTPTNKNYALELFTFETIVGVNLSDVQWTGLTLGEPPSWSWLTPTPGKYVHLVQECGLMCACWGSRFDGGQPRTSVEVPLGDLNLSSHLRLRRNHAAYKLHQRYTPLKKCYQAM